MQNAPLVRRFQRAHDMQGERESLFGAQRSLQRSAIDEFKNQVIRTDIVNLADVRMIQRRNRPAPPAGSWRYAAP